MTRKMRSASPASSAPGSSRAFTLVEVLAVVTVIAILLSVTTAAFQGVMVAKRLSSTSSQLTADLAWCRLLAAKENRPVWLEFIRAPEEKATDGGQYRAWDVVSIHRSTGAREVLVERTSCGQGIMIHPDAAYSTLLSNTTNATAGVLGQIAFLPSGGTNLRPPSAPQDTRWCVTLVIESEYLKNPSAQLPRNHRTLVINALTGAVREY